MEENEKKDGLGKEIVRNLFDKHLKALLITGVTITYLIVNRQK